LDWPGRRYDLDSIFKVDHLRAVKCFVSELILIRTSKIVDHVQ